MFARVKKCHKKMSINVGVYLRKGWFDNFSELTNMEDAECEAEGCLFFAILKK